MVLNQQLEEGQLEDFSYGLVDLLDWFLPYTTNYLERKEAWWHKEYNNNNKYVEEEIEDTETPYTKQYHNARSKFTKKQSLIEYISSKDYLDTEKALEVLEKVTGINYNIEAEELTVEEICKRLGKNIKIVK